MFLKRAQSKQQNGKTLSSLEERLLNPDFYGPFPLVELTNELFERGASAGGGTGIGLDLAHSIIKAHNGSIQMFNNDGPGATVQIEIPVSG
jgi:hypothetical protein